MNTTESNISTSAGLTSTDNFTTHMTTKAMTENSTRPTCQFEDFFRKPFEEVCFNTSSLVALAFGGVAIVILFLILCLLAVLVKRLGTLLNSQNKVRLPNANVSYGKATDNSFDEPPNLSSDLSAVDPPSSRPRPSSFMPSTCDSERPGYARIEVANPNRALDYSSRPTNPAIDRIVQRRSVVINRPPATLPHDDSTCVVNLENSSVSTFKPSTLPRSTNGNLYYEAAPAAGYVTSIPQKSETTESSQFYSDAAEISAYNSAGKGPEIPLTPMIQVIQLQGNTTDTVGYSLVKKADASPVVILPGGPANRNSQQYLGEVITENGKNLKNSMTNLRDVTLIDNRYYDKTDNSQ